MIIKGAEPFFMEGNRIGCVLIHGFSSSPSEMRILGNFLNEKGYSVTAPLLPGHGTKPEDMLKYGWRDWYQEVESAFKYLTKQNCTKIYLIGLSMGSLIALYGAAQKLPVSGVIAMAPPIHFEDKLVYAAPIVKYFKKSVKKTDVAKSVDGIQRVTYNELMLQGVHELLKLRRKVKKSLGTIKKPVLIVHSKDDRVCLPSSAQYVQSKLGSSLKILKWLARSGHIVTMGPEREEMFAQIDHFIQQLS